MTTDALDQTEIPSADRSGMPSRHGLTTTQVYEAHFRYLWRCLRGLGVRDDFVEDAIHDVFLVVQRDLGAFDGNVRLTTWLYAIALRVARRYRARASKEAAKLVCPSGDADVEPEWGGAEAGDDAELSLEQGERLELARRALARLDDDKREAFVLACVEQLPASEISKITGLPVNTMYSRIRAARREFRAQLARLQLARRPR